MLKHHHHRCNNHSRAAAGSSLLGHKHKRKCLADKSNHIGGGGGGGGTAANVSYEASLDDPKRTTPRDHSLVLNHFSAAVDVCKRRQTPLRWSKAKSLAKQKGTVALLAHNSKSASALIKPFIKGKNIMKLGSEGLCSPISQPESAESFSQHQQRRLTRQKAFDTGLTGEFVAIKLESPRRHNHEADVILSPLTTTTATVDIDESLEQAANEEDDEAAIRRPIHHHDDCNPLVRAHRRRFEMLKCSSAHNILKASIAFVTKNNARISLSPIRGSSKREPVDVVGLNSLRDGKINSINNLNFNY